VIASGAKQSRATRDDREAALDCFVAIAPRDDEVLLNRTATRSDKGSVSRFRACGELLGSFLGRFGDSFDLLTMARSRLGFGGARKIFERYDVCLV
jgi:hypothetical protein